MTIFRYLVRRDDDYTKGRFLAKPSQIYLDEAGQRRGSGQESLIGKQQWKAWDDECVEYNIAGVEPHIFVYAIVKSKFNL